MSRNSYLKYSVALFQKRKLDHE